MLKGCLIVMAFAWRETLENQIDTAVATGIAIQRAQRPLRYAFVPSPRISRRSTFMDRTCSSIDPGFAVVQVVAGLASTYRFNVRDPERPHPSLHRFRIRPIPIGLDSSPARLAPLPPTQRRLRIPMEPVQRLALPTRFAPTCAVIEINHGDGLRLRRGNRDAEICISIPPCPRVVRRAQPEGALCDLSITSRGGALTMHNAAALNGYMLHRIAILLHALIVRPAVSQAARLAVACADQACTIGISH